MTERSRTSLYDAAEALLAGKDRRKVDHHTYLERRDDGAGYPAHIALKYHRTDVLRFIPDTADAAGYSDARSRLEGKTQTLQPDRIEDTALGTAAVYTMDHSMIAACPHFILVPSHYRADGSCRCDDATHSEMKEWGYTWNDTDGRWTA